MQVIPIKTRVLTPPQDSLATVLDEYLIDIQEGDVIAISSKVIALDEGRCVPAAEVNKEDLVATEADFIVPRPYWNSPLTVTSHAFLGAAGIDESNGAGYLILLPENPFASAKRWHQHLVAHHKLTNLGVIVTDSHSTPFRYGATGVALGWHGFKPLEDHRGRPDLFGREIQYERSNL
jgi:F420-0:gamma-glutamyl ligase